MKRLLRMSLFGGAALLAALIGYIVIVGINIPLTGFKTQIEQAVGGFIHRQVTIDGGLSLTLSLKPAIEIHDITIANPAGWTESTPMLSAYSGTGQLDALSLISGDIKVMHFRMSGVEVNLVMREDHRANYHFELAGTPDTAENSDRKGSSLRLASVDEVHLEDISIVYHDALSGNAYDFTIDNAYGTAPEDDALSLNLAGQLVGQPLSIEISGDELSKLVQLEDYWSLRSGTLTFADTAVSLTGNVGKEPGSMSGHVDLTLTGSGLAELGRPFGIALPDPGPFTLAVRLGISPAVIEASRITIESSPVELKSDLLLWLHGERPTLMGSVLVDYFNLDLIDMQQNQLKPETAEDTEDPARQFLNVLNQEITFGFLQFIDTDVRVKGSELQLGSIALKDVDGVVSLVDGDLVVPLHADVMGVEIDTQLEIVAGSEASFVSLTGEVEEADLTSLMADAKSSDDTTVKIGKFDYDIESSGKTLKNFIKNIRADIQINDAMAASIDKGTLFSADAFSVGRSDDKTWKISGAGQLLGRPFSTKTLSGKLRDGQDGPIRGIQLNLEACDAELVLELLAAEQGQPILASIDAQGHNLCNVLKPAEQFLGGKSHFTVTGHGELGEERWEIDFDTVGFNTFSGSAAISMHNTESGKPFMTVDVHSPSLNIDELLNNANKPENHTSVNPAEKGEAAPPPQDAGSETDKKLAQKIIAILTNEFPALNFLTVADVDLVFQLDELIMNGGAITDVHLDTHLRDGKILNSPFAADMSGTEVRGAVALDLMSGKPVFNWDFSSSHAELSQIFSSFGLPQSPDLKADNISVSIVFEGNSLLEMLQTSSQEIRVENGLWKIGSQAFDEPMLIKIDRGTYASQADDPAEISIIGSLKDEPLSMEISENGLLARGTDRPVELSMEASVGDLNLQFDGEIRRNPGDKTTIYLDTLVSGSRLDKLNRLLEYDLPPLGPYKLHGAMHTAKNVLTLDQLRAEVGGSVLTGEVTLTIQKDEEGKLINPSVLDASFKAPSLQIDDFHIREWASVADEKESDQEHTEEELRPEAESKDGGYADLLSSEFSDIIEAHLEVIVEEVLSGTDRLGSGYLSAHNQNGRNTIESMRVEVPGGFFEMDGYFQQQDDTSEADFHLNMDQFDYGVLARRMVSETDIKGLMNIRIDLSAVADAPLSLKEHINGKLRVGVVPEHMEAGIIDLWAVNILTAVLPKVMEGSESEINCLAADFTFDDGMITPEVFLLDTSRMRVLGEGFVNLKDESIDFHMKPTPKSPHFFSLATPVDVTGTIRDFHIGVSAGSVIGTVFRVVSGVITVPLQKIFTEDMAADGAEACSAAMAWVVE